MRFIRARKSNTASASFAADLAAGYWVEIVNLASIPLVSASQIGITPSGGITATDVQDAMYGIDARTTTNTANIATNSTAIATNTTDIAANTAAIAAGVAIVGTPTNGHLATWSSSTGLEDGGAAGALANLSSIGAVNVSPSAQGMTAPLNLSLSATLSGTSLVVAINGANGVAPSTTNPVLVPFRSATIGSGVPVVASLQSALSITVPSPIASASRTHRTDACGCASITTAAHPPSVSSMRSR